jgi:autotransporter-associated beta strand protein
MLSSRHTTLIALLCVAVSISRSQTIITWANTGTDLTLPLSWGGTAPSGSTVVEFGTVGVMLFQPNVGANTSVAGVKFSTTSNNYTVGGTGTLSVGSSGIINLSTGTAQTISAAVQFNGTSAAVVNADSLELGPITNSTGAPLVLDGAGALGVISGAITGAGGLVKTGPGTWSLNASNSYGGATTINQGTLNVGAGGALPAGADVTISPTIDGAATLNIGAATQSIGNLLFGGFAGSNASLMIAADSTVTLGGTLTFDATNNPNGASITGGTLAVGADRVVAVGHSDANSDSPDLTIDSAITGSGGLTKTGAGVLLLLGDNSYTGTTTISDGTLQVGDDSYSSGIAGDIVNNAALVFGRSPLNYSGIISGTGTVEVNDLLTLTGNSTYTGATTINASGTLQLGQGDAENSGAIGSTTIVNHGTIVVDRSNPVSLTGISGEGELEKHGDGTLTLAGANTYQGNTYIYAGTVTDQGDGAFSPGSSVYLFSGALSVAGNETIGALGNLMTDAIPDAPPSVTITANKTLTVTGGSEFSGAITGAGDFEVGDGAYQVLLGNVTITGTTRVAPDGTLQIGDNTEVGSVSGAIVNNGTLSFKRAGSVSAGMISGNGVLEQNGTGTLTLTGSNTYSGGTFVTAGVLTDASPMAFSPNSRLHLNQSGAAVTVAYDETVQGLDGDSSGTTLTIGSGATLTVDQAGSSYAGLITGAGALALSGEGTQVLGGANTYSGGTWINSGSLVVTNASGSATGTGKVTIANGATLQLGVSDSGGMVSGNIANNGNINFTSSDSTATYAGVISGSGSLSINSSGGTLTLAGVNVYTGPTFLNTGTLRIGAVNALPVGAPVSFGGSGVLDLAANQRLTSPFGGASSGHITIESGATLTLAPAASTPQQRVGAVITGSGALQFAGVAGTIVNLTGPNTYGGGTIVSSGTLAAAGQSLGSGTVTVAGGATLGGTNSETSSTTFTNAISLADGANLQGGGDEGPLLLGGVVTVPAADATVNLSGTVAFTGTLKADSGSTALTIASSGGNPGRAVMLGAADASITSLTASGDAIIFGSAAALPASGLSLAANTGYLGVGTMTGYTTPTVAALLNLVADKGSYAGTIGFDTLASSVAPHVFDEAIDLSAFGSGTTLGSTTTAVLSGAIIAPTGAGYSFGNGGGALVVQSNLGGTNGLSVNSVDGIRENALSLILQGNNSFSGGTSVTNSILVLDSANALPAGQAVTLGTNGYVGFTEAFTGEATLSDFIAHRIAGYTPTSIIGLDSHAYLAQGLSSGTPYGMRYDSEALDLSGLGSVYFGTRSDLELDGTIRAPAQNGAGKVLRLMPLNGAHLTIASSLVPDNVSGVVIGSTAMGLSTGTVYLSARNTYTGGTTLLNGMLAVSQDSLGTGVITVPENSQKPVLAASDTYVYLNNPVSLASRLAIGQLGASFGELIFDGPISGSGGLDIFEDTSLYGDNLFSGGVTLRSGELWIGSDHALGTGALTIDAGPNYSRIGTYNGAHTIPNSIVFNSAYDQDLLLTTDTALTVAGALQLNSNMNLMVYGEPVRFTGPVTGTGRLAVDWGTVYVDPSSPSTNASGFEAYGGSIILGSPNALPAGNGAVLTSSGGGYVGVAFVPANLQADFINRFTTSNTIGTIGFDSPSLAAPNVFTGPIDLSRFAGAPSLGSASTAVLTGTITPKSDVFMFGGGGGFLQVNSALTDDLANLSSPVSRSLFVTSYGYSGSSSLTLRLTGNNSFSGSTFVTNSGLIFGIGALPPSPVLPASAGNINGSTGAYIGTEDPGFALNPAGFISRISSNSIDTTVGFDSFDGTITVSGPVSLGTLNGSDSDHRIAIGTATSAIITGAITLADVQSAYRFVGYKGGQLTIASNLSDGLAARAVVIGNDATEATFGSSPNADGVLSSVTLTGANTYSGGTQLDAGQLFVGSGTALGTGTVTVSDQSFGDHHPGLFALGTQTISNAIDTGDEAALDLGGDSDLTLTGAIIGAGEIFKTGDGTLTLAGNNQSYRGEMYVQGGELVFDHANSVGTGQLSFGIAGAAATFNESSTVYGISGDNSADTINLAAGITLTVNQTQNATYPGIFTGDDVALQFTGVENPSLTLSGASSFSGSVTVQSGSRLVVANDTAFGQTSNPVVLSGGELAVQAGTRLSNPLTLTAGRLGGSGTFEAAEGGSGFNIGNGVVLQPGMGVGVGSTHFDGHLISSSVLLLGGGGIYQWGLLDATAANGGWDSIIVAGTVDITATSGSPFTFQLNTTDAEGYGAFALNFDPTKPYAWTVLSADSIANFSASKFSIDSSGFLNSANGVFSLSTNGSNTALMLNFTPVPEPSTYALVLAGVGLTFLVSRRRRRS